MLKNALFFYTRHLVVWVLLLGIAAYLWPEPFMRLEDQGTWFFALTMFGIGVVLTADDFKRIAQKPIIVIIGSVAQFTIMPFGAFLIAKLFNLPPEIAVGLILTGSAPGAMASNVMSYVARADTAYSVSLTTVSTLLCPLLTPGLTLLLAGTELDVPFWNMVLYVLKTVIVPLLFGFAVRHYFKKTVEKVLPIFPAISVTFIVFICSLVIALNRDYLGNVTILVFAAVLLLNIYGMLAGYGVGTLFRLAPKRRRTLTLEIGMQNAGLGTLLALDYFGKRAAMPAAIFVFMCIITASVLAAFWQRKDTAQAEQ